jgi:hypothetical protein
MPFKVVGICTFLGVITMTHSIHFWLRWFLLLVGLLGIYSTVSFLLRKRKKISFIEKSILNTITSERTVMMKLAFYGLCCFYVGYFVGGTNREATKLENMQTLANVLVLERHNDFAYRMQTEHGQAFEITFCENSYTDFQPYEKLQILTYEQRKGCKNISGRKLGFVAYTDKNGERLKFPLEVAQNGN